MLKNRKKLLKFVLNMLKKGCSISLSLFSPLLWHLHLFRRLPAILVGCNESNSVCCCFILCQLPDFYCCFWFVPGNIYGKCRWCWDNAKKVVEVDLKEKGTPLHDATIVGDTVGDPFKDTSSVALNPIIKFTTLFGFLAMEIAISDAFHSVAPYVGAGFFLVALYLFSVRSIKCGL